jgi:transposase, IS6 family
MVKLEAICEETATATIKGFEMMRMIRRGHCLTCKRGAKNEVRFINFLFGVAA